MTTDQDVLSREIERVIHAHFAATRLVVEATLKRAFGSPSIEGVKAAKTSSSPSPGKRPRRRRAELAAVAEQLCEAVRASPGERISVLANALGIPTLELERPMTQLKTSGRVRSVGQRHLTRYFPMAVEPKAVPVCQAATGSC